MAAGPVKKVKIVFYSGTGNTRKVAGCFQEELEAKGIEVDVHPLVKGIHPLVGEEDLLLVVYAVHACNAPEAVYKWIGQLPEADGKKAAVVSVSGGGEASPNTACGVGCIGRLEKKGYDVIYDKMLVMPSNWIVPTKEPLALKLLEVLPEKVQLIIDDILSGVRRRSGPLLIDRIFSALGEFEKFGAKQFGKRIRRSSTCNGCGWCSDNCPAGNIKMVDDRPVFMRECHLCLNCLYGCPSKALSPAVAGFIMIKEGFSLKALEKKMPYTEPADVEKLAKGWFWVGVKKYLLIKDF